MVGKAAPAHNPPQRCVHFTPRGGYGKPPSEARQAIAKDREQEGDRDGDATIACPQIR
jgi:hypothetical protein